MKQHFRFIPVVMALLLCVCIFGIAVLADDTPETEYTGSDLPVSESYVLRALSVLEARINEKIDTAIANIAQGLPSTEAPADSTAPETDVPTAETQITDTETDTETPNAAISYEVVCLKQGQSITGSCELILRSGTATALCPGANGISDLTAGADLPGGTAITANHLLIVPRDDGRGLTVTSAEAYIMVRGSYTIK